MFLPQRFNVAVTRAKALLVVVGNPFLLRADKHWNQLLQFALSSGGYVGVDVAPEEDEDADIADRIAAVKLDKAGAWRRGLGQWLRYCPRRREWAGVVGVSFGRGPAGGRRSERVMEGGGATASGNFGRFVFCVYDCIIWE